MLSDLYDIISCLIDDTAEKSDMPQVEYGSQEYVWSAIRYIDAHYPENITVESLAENVGITRKYFYNIFRGLIHVSPREYIINYRMHRACELLRSHKFTVAQTAHAVGYGDGFHFSKMFKKIIGMPPSEYVTGNQDNSGLSGYLANVELGLNATIQEKGREIERLKKIIERQNKIPARISNPNILKNKGRNDS